jgi:hypothetical protein
MKTETQKPSQKLSGMEEVQEGVDRLRSGRGMAGKISEIDPIIREGRQTCEREGT